MIPFDRAQAARAEIEMAILDLLKTHSEGLRNIDVARKLGLESPKDQPQKNYFTWEILRRLIEQDRVFEARDERSPRYYAKAKQS